jgi:Glycosyltransferases involved in cell wall biogenesis
MNVRASFIIAVYNGAPFIAESIDSCLAQGPDVEVCVVDDGSTDETWLRLEAYRDHPSVRLGRFEQNRGKVAAFNAAFALSQGEVILIHCADDTCKHDRLAVCLPHLEQARAQGMDVLVYGGYTLCDAVLTPKKSVLPGTNVSTLWDLVDGNKVGGGTSCLNRGLAEKIFPLPETLRFEDWWIACQTLLHKAHIIGLPHEVINYRIHGQNATMAEGFASQWRVSISDFKRHYVFYTLLQEAILSSTLPEQEKQALLRRIQSNVLYRDIRIGTADWGSKTFMLVLRSYHDSSPRLFLKSLAAFFIAPLMRVALR